MIKQPIKNNDMYQAILRRLDMMYEREDEIKSEINILVNEWNQLQEDKELCQYMIMHYSNKQARHKDGNIN